MPTLRTLPKKIRETIWFVLPALAFALAVPHETATAQEAGNALGPSILATAGLLLGIILLVGWPLFKSPAIGTMSGIMFCLSGWGLNSDGLEIGNLIIFFGLGILVMVHYKDLNRKINFDSPNSEAWLTRYQELRDALAAATKPGEIALLKHDLEQHEASAPDGVRQTGESGVSFGLPKPKASANPHVAAFLAQQQAKKQAAAEARKESESAKSDDSQDSAGHNAKIRSGTGN